MTLAEWDEDASKMSDVELVERKAALDVLKAWPTFHQEFKWTGYYAFYWTLQGEQNLRAIKKEQEASKEQMANAV